jgi:hypothetical protein
MNNRKPYPTSWYPPFIEATEARFKTHCMSQTRRSSCVRNAPFVFYPPRADVNRMALEWNPQGSRRRGRPNSTWRRSSYGGQSCRSELERGEGGSEEQSSVAVCGGCPVLQKTLIEGCTGNCVFIWCWKASERECWVKFHVLMVARMKMTSFWDMAPSPCSLVEIDRRFWGSYCLHHQVDRRRDYTAPYPRMLSSSWIMLVGA